MRLSSALVTNDESKSSFGATLDAHGLYSTQQFVLRLSPRNHQLLADGPSGVSRGGGFDIAQAMSTYLHETVHWWQHIGSTYGFLLSMNFPVQTHTNYEWLKKLVVRDGFRKSVLLQSASLMHAGRTGIDSAAAASNYIVNTHNDLMAFRALTLGPGFAKSAIENPLFESVGHSFYMTYANSVGMIGATIDPNFDVFQHPKKWEREFENLSDEQVEGYYRDSPVGLWPIGSYEIFEGQARFCQIQFLSESCNHRLVWDDYQDVGMLGEVYVKAFLVFLALIGESWPDRVDDPIVSLFLLVCDLAINPGSGFPFPIAPGYSSFISDVDPGARFVMFSRLIADQHAELKGAIVNCDRSEYEAATSRLCDSASLRSPTAIAQTFAAWFENDGPLAGLRKEYETYSFEHGNFVVRHLLAHFLAFQSDKFDSPERYCWPGAWMAGERLSKESAYPIERHGALFVDKEHDDGVFPRIQTRLPEDVVHAAFDEFYQNTVVFGLTDQWISQPGPFNYDMGWLVASASDADRVAYQKKQFSLVYGLEMDNVDVLNASN